MIRHQIHKEGRKRTVYNGPISHKKEQKNDLFLITCIWLLHCTKGLHHTHTSPLSGCTVLHKNLSLYHLMCKPLEIGNMSGSHYNHSNIYCRMNEARFRPAAPLHWKTQGWCSQKTKTCWLPSWLLIKLPGDLGMSLNEDKPMSV